MIKCKFHRLYFHFQLKKKENNFYYNILFVVSLTYRTLVLSDFHQWCNIINITCQESRKTFSHIILWLWCRRLNSTITLNCISATLVLSIHFFVLPTIIVALLFLVANLIAFINVTIHIMIFTVILQIGLIINKIACRWRIVVRMTRDRSAKSFLLP